MDIHVKIADKIEIDNFILQKMTFLYNALENGWDIKKADDKYIFSKNHEQEYLPCLFGPPINDNANEHFSPVFTYS